VWGGFPGGVPPIAPWQLWIRFRSHSPSVAKVPFFGGSIEGPVPENLRVFLDKADSLAHIVWPLVQPAWAWRFQND